MNTSTVSCITFFLDDDNVRKTHGVVEYRRSPENPWRFDEYKCGSLDDRHPWILTSADAMHGEVCCGDTSSTCCGMKGWKRVTVA